jgi:hypothetical protein
VGKIHDGKIGELSDRYTALRSDPEYEKAITTNTSDADSVETRFRIAEKFLLA